MTTAPLIFNVKASKFTFFVKKFEKYLQVS